MWPFKRYTSLKDSGIFNGFTDWHCHLLPGVDDGVQTMEEALKILHLYEELNVTSVWLTPHIMEDIPNTTMQLKERFTELQTAYHGPIALHLAAENMLDTLFQERLEQNDVLPLGERGDHLLVETSYFSPPVNLYGILQLIQKKGYVPVLAHPERYIYMGKTEYLQLKEQGVKFQLNLPSLAGRYGKTTAQKAKWLIKRNIYEIAGTDVHQHSGLQHLLQSTSDKRLLQQCHLSGLS